MSKKRKGIKRRLGGDPASIPRSASIRNTWASIVMSCSSRSTVTALLLSLTIGAAAIWLLSPLARGLDSAVIGQTASRYFEIAVNRSYCGRYPYVTSTVGNDKPKINLSELHIADVGAIPIRRMIEQAGSPRGYCQTSGGYIPVNEVSMALVESALLSAAPGLTLRQLGQTLPALSAIALLLFAFFLLKLRYSIVFAFSTLLSSLYITILLGGSALYSQYPLILPATLAGISLAGLCLVYRVHLRTSWYLCSCFILGLWCGFLGNLRTSHYQEGVFVGVLLIGFAAVDMLRVTSKSKRKTAVLACMAFTAFAAGVLTFDALFISPLRAVPTPGIYSYHVLAHPLVLGLATPPNELAKREGIAWDDPAGVVAARKVDPTVTYLGPGYERALFTYYLRLWSSHPLEMLGIYFSKLSSTRESIQKFLLSTQANIFWTHKDGRWLELAALPATLGAALIGVLGLFGVLFVIGCIRPAALQVDLQRGFCLAAVFGAGIIAFVESAAVLSEVVLWYSTVLVFSFIIAGLFVFQMVLDVFINRIWRGPQQVSRSIARNRH